MTAALEVRLLRDPEQLFALTDAWTDLADDVEISNIFYEPWMLKPALANLRGGNRIEFALVVEKSISGGEERLCALFPLERCPSLRGLPMSHYRLWKHRHSFLCTPLIRRKRVNESLKTFFDWLESAPGVPRLFVWNSIDAQGEIGESLRTFARNRHWTTGETSYERAVLPRMNDPEAYLRGAISKKHLKEFGRHERRLQEAGTVGYERLDRAGPADAWIEDFLNLEASGWKGRQGTALNCTAADRGYFTAIARAAFAAGKLFMYRLRLDGETIAAVCEFLGKEAGFSLKTAYSEEHAQYRPSMLLQLWHIRHIADVPRELVDSCADPDHPLLDRLWQGRRAIMTLTTARRRFPEGLLVAGARERRRIRAAGIGSLLRPVPAEA